MSIENQSGAGVAESLSAQEIRDAAAGTSEENQASLDELSAVLHTLSDDELIELDSSMLAAGLGSEYTLSGFPALCRRSSAKLGVGFWKAFGEKVQDWKKLPEQIDPSLNPRDREYALSSKRLRIARELAEMLSWV